MFTVSIGKTGKSIEVNFDELPQVSKDYIIQYGLKQKLNDVSASITSDNVPDDDERAEQKLAMAENALAALVSGDITVRQSASGQTLEEREKSKWLRAKYKALFKAKIAELDDTSDEFFIGKIATKLGITEDVLTEKLDALAIKLAEKARQIAALKKSPDLDF